MLSFQGLQCGISAHPGDSLILSEIDLALEPGQRVALLGANGSGKSTLLRCLSGLVDYARWGECLLNGRHIAADEEGRALLRRHVGRVGQDPEDQLVSERVFDEVAFGPCNIGLSPLQVRQQVDEALACCDITDLSDKLCSELSGGQRQRVCIAGVLAMHPAYLLLDEPCSMLDPESRSHVLGAVDAAAARGVGVIMATHELRDVLGYDRVIVLEQGSIIWAGTPAQLLARPDVILSSGCLLSAWPQALVDLAASGALPADVVLSTPVACGEFLRSSSIPFVSYDCFERTQRHVPIEEQLSTPQASVDGLSLEHVSFSYDLPAPRRRLGKRRTPRSHITPEDLRELACQRGAALALDDVSLHVSPGSLAVVSGPNGAGKTTLLRIACGLIEPATGQTTLVGGPIRPGDVACAMQRPFDQLFCDTVAQDVAFSPLRRGVCQRRTQELVEDCMRRVGLEPAALAQRSPFSLSGGQARRAVLAGVLACEASAVVLDEPAAGLDAHGLSNLLSIIDQMRKADTAVIVVTHDPKTLLKQADTLLFLDSGRVGFRVHLRNDASQQPLSDFLPQDSDDLFFRAWAGARYGS